MENNTDLRLVSAVLEEKEGNNEKWYRNMVENVPNLAKDTNIQIHEAE